MIDPAAPFHLRPATALRAAYAAGTASPVAVLEAVQARARACEPHLHALWQPDADRHAEALVHEAEASARRWAEGRPLGPLDGIPVTVKENLATAGLPVRLGCAGTDDHPAVADAPPVARLKESGALIVARTTMPDLGMLSSGVSSLHATTRNPWRLDRNPGGSSGGAAAAAAGGYGPLHIGTDIGGSIRLPAAWCGVAGFKPSLGRIPIDPPYAGRVAGPLARTVGDLALAMQGLSRPDPLGRDGMALPYERIDWGDLEPSAWAGSPPRLDGLRLGLWLDAGWGLPLQPEVERAVRAAASRFERAGAQVDEMPAFLRRSMMDGLDAFWRLRAWLEVSSWPMARQQQVLPFIAEWARGGARLSGTQVFHGQAQMAAMRDAALAACRPFDAVLCPVAPIVAYEAELPSPTDDPGRPLEHIAYTVAFNMSEQPALSLNAGWTDDGLPIGLQIVGRRHADLAVLRLGRVWERLRDADGSDGVPQPEIDRVLAAGSAGAGG